MAGGELMSAVGFAECMVCVAPAVRSARYGKSDRIVLCGYHANLLGKSQSFSAALKKRHAEKRSQGRKSDPEQAA